MARTCLRSGVKSKPLRSHALSTSARHRAALARKAEFLVDPVFLLIAVSIISRVRAPK
jgi:hypothetical protein